MSRQLLVLFAALVMAASVSACSDDNNQNTAQPPDGNNEEADAGDEDTGEPVEDVEEEPPPLEASTLFGPCVEDSQCPGEGAICRTAAESGLPGGFCTVPCEDRTPCDANNAYHHCLLREGETQRYCERRCLNGLDCGRSAYTCQPPAEGNEEIGGVCFGLCSTDEHCGDGNRCEPHSGLCTEGEPSTEGQITGGPCAAAEDCRSEFCVTEADAGWPGGMCFGRCILPAGFNSTSFYGGDTLPAGDCPGDSLCLGVLGSLTRGDLGACLKACNTAVDCRSGYVCRKEFEGSGGVSTFQNGVCWPG